MTTPQQETPTPRTDMQTVTLNGKPYVSQYFTRQLERALAAATAENVQHKKAGKWADEQLTLLRAQLAAANERAEKAERDTLALDAELQIANKEAMAYRSLTAELRATNAVEALAHVAKLSTSQTASPEQCAIVVEAMDASAAALATLLAKLENKAT